MDAIQATWWSMSNDCSRCNAGCGDETAPHSGTKVWSESYDKVGPTQWAQRIEIWMMMKEDSRERRFGRNIWSQAKVTMVWRHYSPRAPYMSPVFLTEPKIDNDNLRIAAQFNGCRAWKLLDICTVRRRSAEDYFKSNSSKKVCHKSSILKSETSIGNTSDDCPTLLRCSMTSQKHSLVL